MGTSGTPLQYVIVDRLGALFYNSLPFDSTTPIYLINVLWKLGLGLWLEVELYHFRIFHGE